MSLVNREKNIKAEELTQLGEENTKTKSNFWDRMSVWNKLKIAIGVAVVGFLGVTFVTSLYQNSTSILVDNPTDSAITITINELPAVEIGAYSSLTTKIGKGENTVYMDGEEIGTFTRKATQFNAFLNPTNEIYISEYTFYGEGDHWDKLPNNKITAYGNETEGPFEKHEGLYISGGWDYDLDEEFPAEVSMKSSQKYVIRQKIYRFDDFVEMYNSYYASGDAE